MRFLDPETAAGFEARSACEPDDGVLMQRFTGGDMAAFEQLYARHRGGLMRFLQRGLGRRETAEECFQEVWSRVIAARDRFQPEARFATWLYQIAHNLLIDQYRRQRPEVNVEVLPEESEARDNPFGDSGALTPEEQLSAFEQTRRLQLALAELPDEQRIALQLRLEQELSLEEIGAITGAGRETVKSRLRYALDKLKDRLRR
ncbi:RNA polymerase sigma factor [Aquimonas voraii]|uniref:RNA polymerase, sigma subunit, ECF family n=1 Tax=Aquimonas voraii TaxID=265719 RepID=A0A1G6UV47_9GAMM|nr:RNA polymerase sigma factor [Aquimonas voraii]SDD45143.1 RNA polymerase, sigma subunit, ECF family [Aquimonas voraii]